MINYPWKKIKFASVFFIYMSIPLNPLIANELRSYLLIDMLVRSCYKDIKSCNESLFKINKYQINAAKNRRFSCQTRLLGLEANLIMASNSNLKRSEAKSIIQAIKKYC
ncbi:hypothetical protein [Prochlorococcus sp. MIT 0916]|uniref:hypothetical protein n=1 Tax=Prochlorococcus sp. MIT 0916 TaxID=3082521 RepID=UPI0039B50540